MSIEPCVRCHNNITGYGVGTPDGKGGLICSSCLPVTISFYNSDPLSFRQTTTMGGWTAVITAWRCNGCHKEFPSIQPHGCEGGE